MFGSNTFGAAYYGFAEAGAVTPTRARVSQAAIETLEKGASLARLSQLAVEVAKQRPTGASVGMTQLATEVIYRIPIETKAVLSQLVVEVLVPPAPFVHTRFWAQIL